MTRDEVLNVLKAFLEECGQKYGIISLGVFGSVARDCATEESDVDVVIQLKKPNLFALSGIRIELEDRLHKHVDLISFRERMNPFVKARIEEDACYV